MKACKCDVWTILNNITTEIGQWVSKLVDKVDESVHNFGPSFIKPYYDVIEMEDTIRVNIEISGLTEDSLHTSISGRRICIYFKKKRPIIVEPHEIAYTNREFGMCRLYIILSNKVLDSDIYEPIYEEGVLTLIFQKKVLSDTQLLSAFNENGDGDDSFEVYIDNRSGSDSEEEINLTLEPENKKII